MTDTEKAALERRIDELCQENERLRADQAHWELGNCPSCPNVVSLQEALEQNAKLRELARDMMWTIRHTHGYFKNDTHEMLMTYVRGRDGKPTHVSHSLTCDEEEYERRMVALGIEVPE